MSGYETQHLPRLPTRIQHNSCGAGLFVEQVSSLSLHEAEDMLGLVLVAADDDRGEQDGVEPRISNKRHSNLQSLLPRREDRGRASHTARGPHTMTESDRPTTVVRFGLQLTGPVEPSAFSLEQKVCAECRKILPKDRTVRWRAK